MKLHRKILFTAFSLLLTLGLFSLAACKAEEEVQPVSYSVTVTCEDESVLGGIGVSLQTEEGAIEGGEMKALTLGKAEFLLPPATYKVVLSGVPEDYTFEAASVSVSSPAATIALLKTPDNPDEKPDEPENPDKPDEPDKPVKPEPIEYTVYLNLTAAEEEAFQGITVALETLEGGAVEGGEARAAAEDANFRIYARFSVLPGDYRVVLSGFPDNYFWPETTLTKDSPSATVSFSHDSDYTVTVVCADEEILGGVKVALRNTLDGAIPEGGEARPLTAGKAAFRMRVTSANTQFRVELSGVPADYGQTGSTVVSDLAPDCLLTLEKHADPPVAEEGLPQSLGGKWESTNPSMAAVTFEKNTVTVEGALGTGSAEATEIVKSGDVWEFKASLSIEGKKLNTSFRYNAAADTLEARTSPSAPLFPLTRHREEETVTAFPDGLVGTIWKPVSAVAGLSEVRFTQTNIVIGGQIVTPAEIKRLDDVYTFEAEITVEAKLHFAFTYRAAEDTLTLRDDLNSRDVAFEKQASVDPDAFGEVAASLPDETAAELAKAAWTSDDEIVAQVTFEKIAATYGIKVIIHMNNGKGGPVSALIENGEIRKDGNVYQIAYIPAAGTNITYTVLLRYDTAAKTLTALYGSSTVSLTQDNVQEDPSVYPAELEGTTWLNADDPDGTVSGIRSITFIGGEIRWVDANGNTQLAVFGEALGTTIWMKVDPAAGIPYNTFGIKYAGGSMEVTILSVTYSFTKQA